MILDSCDIMSVMVVCMVSVIVYNYMILDFCDIMSVMVLYNLCTTF